MTMTPAERHAVFEAARGRAVIRPMPPQPDRRELLAGERAEYRRGRAYCDLAESAVRIEEDR